VKTAASCPVGFYVIVFIFYTTIADSDLHIQNVHGNRNTCILIATRKIRTCESWSFHESLIEHCGV